MYICIEFHFLNLQLHTFLTMKYSVKFFPEKRKEIINGLPLVIEKNVPVLCSISWASKRIFYYTGKRCDLKQWDFKENKLAVKAVPIDGSSFSNFNNYFAKITIAIEDLFKIYDVRSIVPDPKLLRQDLKLKLSKIERIKYLPNFINLLEIFYKKLDSKNSKESTNALILHLKSFDKDISIHKLDIQKFYDFLTSDRELAKSTATKYLLCLNRFFNELLKENLISENPFNNFVFPPVFYGEPVYISIEERDKLLLKKFSYKQRNLSIYRDIFVLQCHLGCRYGDLMRLTKANIINNTLQYIPKKTEKENKQIAKIPLTEKAKEIISRYDLPDNKLIPHIDLAVYDSNIKLLFKETNITRLVTVIDKKTGIDKQVPINEIASSHMARRCFIGGLLKKGARREVISSMSGHIKNSRAFDRYHAADDDDQRSAISLIE